MKDPELVRELVRYLVAVALFLGGIWILALRIPFWSLFLGIGATQVGIMLAIISFDNTAKKKLEPSNYHLVPCEVCGDPVAVSAHETRGICADCRSKKKGR